MIFISQLNFKIKTNKIICVTDEVVIPWLKAVLTDCLDIYGPSTLSSKLVILIVLALFQEMDLCV